MKFVIAGHRANKSVFYKGDGARSEHKGLGSGALTGTHEVPEFSSRLVDVKEIGTFVDAKRVVGKILDAIRYEEIEAVDYLTIHFIKEVEK